MATLNAWLAAARWAFMEKGMQKYWTDMKAFANAATAGTMPASFGLIDMTSATNVGQGATGRTGIVPGQSFKDPGADRNAQAIPKFDQFRD